MGVFVEVSDEIVVAAESDGRGDARVVWTYDPKRPRDARWVMHVERAPFPPVPTPSYHGDSGVEALDRAASAYGIAKRPL